MECLEVLQKVEQPKIDTQTACNSLDELHINEQALYFKSLILLKHLDYILKDNISLAILITHNMSLKMYTSLLKKQCKPTKHSTYIIET